MTERDRSPISCEAVREISHRILDGDPIDETLRERVVDHRSACAGCRAAFADLSTIQSALRKLPEQPMPDAALEEIWRQTSRAPGGTRRFSAWSFDWRAVAVAAVLAVAVLGLWQARAPEPVDPDPAELARAEADVRRVLGLTARALRDSERSALRGIESILVEEVSPALRRVPLGSTDPETGHEEGENGA